MKSTVCCLAYFIQWFHNDLQKYSQPFNFSTFCNSTITNLNALFWDFILWSRITHRWTVRLPLIYWLYCFLFRGIGVEWDEQENTPNYSDFIHFYFFVRLFRAGYNFIWRCVIVSWQNAKNSKHVNLFFFVHYVHFYWGKHMLTENLSALRNSHRFLVYLCIKACIQSCILSCYFTSRRINSTLWVCCVFYSNKNWKPTVKCLICSRLGCFIHLLFLDRQPVYLQPITTKLCCHIYRSTRSFSLQLWHQSVFNGDLLSLCS